MWKEDGARDQIILYYFYNLFSTTKHKGSMDFLDNITRRVTNSMNEYLLKTYTEQEVIEAIQKMQPTKAPTLDGMALTFYKKY